MSSGNRLQRGVSGVAAVLLVACTLVGAGAGARQAEVRQAKLSAGQRELVEHISAASLRGHLSFIASDALEGRNTPSRGLDIAAEYIAAQFRRAGLEPAGDDGYFQTADLSVRERSLEGFALRMEANGRAVAVPAEAVSLAVESGGRALFAADAPLALERAAVLKVDYKDAAALDALRPEQVEGRVVLTELPDFRREADRRRGFALYDAERKFLARLKELKAALVLSFDRGGGPAGGRGSARLQDPEATPAPARAPATPPLITVHSPDAVRLFDEMGAGAGTVSVQLRAPADRPVRVRNVVGLLRGSDPALRDTYVIVSAHYDHLGTLPESAGAAGDHVYNGANDDGSGTVSVVELASAFAALKSRPKRSILFITFFGEEKGLLGSRFYGRHPVVPIEKTVAQVNLEQVGRTDDSEGPQVSTASVTGFDYSDVGEILRAAGALAGVRVYKHERNSDAYFGRSDNQSLADRGVPAHTLGVAFDFPDYHGLGDEWQKIDYANMERVARAAALGVLAIADNPQPPRWNESNPKTAPYVKAWRELHAPK